MKLKYVLYGGAMLLLASCTTGSKVTVRGDEIQKVPLINKAILPNSVILHDILREYEPRSILEVEPTSEPKEPEVEKPQEPKKKVVKKIKPVIVKGWVHTRVNIRSGPSLDSDVIGVLEYAEQVKGKVSSNKEWVKTDRGYVYRKLIHSKKPEKKKTQYKQYKAPETTGFKSYMTYSVRGKSIFSSKSKQYRLQLGATTSREGIRVVNGRYCVALGSNYTNKIGQYFDLVLKNGTVIKCILADAKADIHTDKNNRITSANGCMSEFIVDVGKLDKSAKRMGDISYIKDAWRSPVEYVRIYDVNYFD